MDRFPAVELKPELFEVVGFAAGDIPPGLPGCDWPANADELPVVGGAVGGAVEGAGEKPGPVPEADETPLVERGWIGGMELPATALPEIELPGIELLEGGVPGLDWGLFWVPPNCESLLGTLVDDAD